MDKNKVLYLTSILQKSGDLPTTDGEIDSIEIEGYANTTNVDRVGDVIPKTAWESALINYLKNPIVLAYHDHDHPIGRVIDHRIEDKGLWVKARISAAAEDVFNLIKDGVLTAFSVGFRILDATYDSVTDLFIIKELELLELSVVSVPMNQDSLFSLSKSFDNDEDYGNFKRQFISEDTSAKGLENPTRVTDKSNKEFNMDPKELEQLLAKATSDAAEKALAAAAEKAAAEKAAAEKAAAEQAALDARIAAVIKTGESGAEKLLAEVEKRFNEQAETQKKTIEDLASALKEKAAEIEALQKSKMSFQDKGGDANATYADREKAVLAAKIMGKSIEDTRFGRQLVEKVGAHLPSATWELEVSRNMEDEIRRRLVVVPNFRAIGMQTNVMKIPVNPEAGLATWIANTSFGTTASPGAAQTHTLKEITLSAYKVATMEYIAYEEEEDSLLVILPIIRDAMIRRVARAMDKSYLHDSTAPFTGVAAYDTTSVVTVTNTGTVTTTNLRALRKDLGAWGIEPSDLRFIVSTETYFDLMDDTIFQTMDKVGSAATVLTGQVGQVGGTPVLVSDAFPARTGGSASTNTNMGAICVAPGNFISGNQRGLRFDTQDLVETQRKVLVASLRTGLTQLSTVNGMGVSTLRHT